MDKLDLIPLLDFIDPDDYGTWIQVGMALHKEGYSLTDWEQWSTRSPKYHYGECEKKWGSFGSYGAGEVSGGTVVKMAQDNGWSPNKNKPKKEHRIFAWDDIIGKDIVDVASIEPTKLPKPNISQVQQLIKYIETLFQSDDIVGFVLKTTQKGEKFVPANAGTYTMTASQILEALRRYGETDSAIGSYDHKAGAWMRINPLDGNGVKNDNITDYRYALVESDTVDIETQYSILQALNLPIATLVHSGGKSLHAIVKIFADTKEEYTERVKQLYEICATNGLEVDTQNRNPSRLSRMPGFDRGDKKQYLIATNIGASNWDEWLKSISLINSKLPKTIGITFDTVINPMPMPPVLIDGILRKGGKMMISSNPKAGKTMLCIQLTLAMISGTEWLGHRCKRGKVLFIDGEIGIEAFQNRLQEVWKKSGLDADIFTDDNGNPMVYYESHVGNFSLMKEVNNFITNHENDNISLLIIDPIYLLLQGDENKAADVIEFTKFVSLIKEGLGCAVAYVHHHSKGAQGDKYSIDRAAGSGVFARDADAIVDLSALEIPSEERQSIIDEDKAEWLNDYAAQQINGWKYMNGQPGEIINGFKDSAFYKGDINEVYQQMEAIDRKRVKAYQVSGTLRSFPDFEPFNVIFKYPVHIIDTRLQKAYVKGSLEPHEQGGQRMSDKAYENRKERDRKFKEVLLNLESVLQKKQFTAEEIWDEYISIFEEDTSYDNFRRRWLPESEILEKTKLSHQLNVYSLKE